MSQEKLAALLGPPLEKRMESGQEYWCYSHAGNRFQNYWNFIAIVDPTAGKVIGRFKEFYTD